MSVGNELAAELGNNRDAMLHALTERSGVNAYLRGNELTLDGADDEVDRARSVVEELAQLVAEGVSVGAQTVDAVAGVSSTATTTRSSRPARWSRSWRSSWPRA